MKKVNYLITVFFILLLSTVLFIGTFGLIMGAKEFIEILYDYGFQIFDYSSASEKLYQPLSMVTFSLLTIILTLGVAYLLIKNRTSPKTH